MFGNPNAYENTNQQPLGATFFALSGNFIGRAIHRAYPYTSPRYFI